MHPDRISRSISQCLEHDSSVLGCVLHASYDSHTHMCVGSFSNLATATTATIPEQVEPMSTDSTPAARPLPAACTSAPAVVLAC